MYWFLNIVSAFLIGFICSAFIIPYILKVAHIKGLVDKPKAPKIHKGDVPRLGGVVFFPVVLFTILFLVAANLFAGNYSLPDMFRDQSLILTSVACAMLVIFAVGVWDDIIGVNYRTKFLVQTICALMIIYGGLRVENLGNLFGIGRLSYGVQIVLTILFTLVITNAMNLIDGLDGLAAGMGIIASVCYALIFGLCGEFAYMIIAITLCGVLIPFFYYNVFGKTEQYRKIFMGDTGSLTIGLLFSVFSLAVCNVSFTDKSVSDANLVAFAFSPVLIPCLDVARVFFERLSSRKNPFLPDRRHIHHRMMDCGISHHGSMCLILLYTLVMLVVNSILSYHINISLILIIDVVSYITIMLIIKAKSVNRLSVETVKEMN